jgi:hypothetical protein
VRAPQAICSHLVRAVYLWLAVHDEISLRGTNACSLMGLTTLAGLEGCAEVFVRFSHSA